MKKLLGFAFLFLVLPLRITASSKIEVKLAKCIDGDTAKFIIDNKKETVRFLAIDTREDNLKKEPYGEEASNFTCQHLKKAHKIELELDPNSDKYDRYHRLLAWVFVDRQLLQEKLVKEGLAKVAYLYGDYKYTERLKKEEKKAQLKKIKIWEESQDNHLALLLTIVLGSSLIIGLTFIKKGKNYKIK